MNFYIDLVLNYSYNTSMKNVSKFYAGFFRHDHDPQCAFEWTLDLPRFFDVSSLLLVNLTIYWRKNVSLTFPVQACPSFR